MRTLPYALAALALAGLARADAPVTQVIAVGQTFLEKAIRVRETGEEHAGVRAVAAAFRDAGAQVQTLSEQQLTRPALRQAIQQAAKAMKPQDNLVFYFNGFSAPGKDGPQWFVQGSGGQPQELIDGSRVLPWNELQGWLAATAAPGLLVVLETGAEAARFCGPWADAAHLPSLTVVCAPHPARAEAADSAKWLVSGLEGGADRDGDHRLSGDELADWLRGKMAGVASYQSGPDHVAYRPPSLTKAVAQMAAQLPPPPVAPKGEKLDALLRALADAGDEKTRAALLERDGMRLEQGMIAVEISLAKDEDLPRLQQHLTQLGGRITAQAGKTLHARVAPDQLRRLADSDAVWSMAASRITVAPLK